MRQRRSPKTAYAVLALTELVDSYAKNGRQRLPSLSELSGRLGLSSMTVCKALTVLKGQGVITAAPRRGIWISLPLVENMHAFSDRQTKAAVLMKWEQVRQRIADDMLSGIYSPGTMLPSGKEMMHRYGTSYDVLRRALGRLEAEHRILRHKKGYRVWQAASRANRPLVVVIASVFIGQNTIAMEFWRALEAECQRLSLAVEFFSFDDFLGGKKRDLERIGRLKEAEKSRGIAGYVLWNYSTNFETISSLYSILAAYAKPVAVYYENSTMPVPAGLTANRRFRLFVKSEGAAVGEMLAHHLVELGHRKLALFTAYAAADWSRARCNGLHDGYAGAGFETAVAAYETDITDKLMAMWNRDPASPIFTGIQPRLVSALRVIDPHIDTADMGYYDYSYLYFTRKFIDVAMRPLFEKALKAGRVSAWVCINDDVAISALLFLKEKHVRVPQELSVVGIDNITDSLGAGLTSYSFNVPAIAVAVLDHILHGRMTRGMPRRAPIVIPGTIMERGSTDRSFR